MKIFFNTNAFDHLKEKYDLNITTDIAEAEIAVLGAKTIDFSKANKLKALYRFGVGSENIPDEIIKKGKPQIFFPSKETRKILYDSTANFTIYLIMHMYYAETLGKIENWMKFTRDSIAHKTLLIIGMGNIGSKVFDKMKTIMQVKSFDIRNNDLNSLEGLIKISDIITLHIPLNDKTKCFIDCTKLTWMKNDSILINTARGDIVDECALYDRLKDTNMRAAFDVFWQEPYMGKLKNLPKEKFYMTPHISSQTTEYTKKGFNDILEIISKLKG